MFMEKLPMMCTDPVVSSCKHFTKEHAQETWHCTSARSLRHFRKACS